MQPLSNSLYVIAEIGTSHGGDRSKARELVHAAAESGADCAKFQVVFADEIVHPKTGELDLPGGRVRIYDRFRAVEQDEEFYRFCREESLRRGLEFLASPFGVESVDLLSRIGATWYKVASPELNHFPMLERLRELAQPVVLSSGVSRLEDIERALEYFEGMKTTLLHCITAYPAPPEEYNLNVLRPLSTLFGVPVGVSDHSTDPSLVPLVSRFAGATMLEKHFCLSRLDPGLDDPIALDPGMFRTMIDDLLAFESIEENERRAFLDDRWGKQRIDAVLGSGRKTLAASERANYERTNRSLHAVSDLKKGAVVRPEDVAVLRTEKILRPGLSPRFTDVVVGSKLTRDVAAGEGIVWDDVVEKPTVNRHV